MNSRPSQQFPQAAQPVTRRRAPFSVAFEDMLRDVKFITMGLDDHANPTALNSREAALQTCFKNFLQKMNMPLAIKNFDALLEEKSGKDFLRGDGTINWLHEFIPLVMVMSLLKQGYNKGGFDLAELEPYGGLECMIISHLRHDSIEDFMSDKDDMMKEQMKFVGAIKAADPSYDTEKAEQIALQSIINIDLMTQKKELQSDGSYEKEDVVLYTYRMVSSEQANPIVFMLKQADVIHNFATLFGARKFSAERRLKRCNEREDMYGPRYDFTDAAKEKWKPFRRAISSLDGMMGVMLYPHFRYLQNVDLHYKKSYDIPVGIPRYIHGALNFKLPEIINPLHIFMKRLSQSVKPSEDAEKYGRLQNFMSEVMLPHLKNHSDRFSYLFKNEGQKPVPQHPAVATP
ncbi:MAG: hypothetical protein DI626_07415 [Micavibrio aeruginosavorus]|uniref:Uncharacterized protein n=1 Tax=Micavibrio aeruginosavorus TaxID=349221 RepID=A0A2W4ZWH6_9BACT|nr:MAG: hypothetical protein DI626_07415 [Micavibrio aeruginosavorus]